MLGRKVRAAAAVALAAAVLLTALLVGNPRLRRWARREVVISIAGDIMLDRGVATVIAEHGMDYPYSGVAEIFRGDDITVANLECPLTSANVGAAKDKRIVFKADAANAAALKAAGFEVLILANNHTMDYMSSGLADTMEALDGAGLRYAGAGASRGEIRPCFIDANGVRVGVLAYSSLPPEGFMDDESRATIAYAREGFLEDMQRNVAEAAGQCDFLLVYFHWGIEYRHDVSEAQVSIAHAAVDAGAGAVVGAHPHVLQGRETYRGAPIYYSVGNFVFDKQLPDGTDEALIVQLTVGKNGVVSVSEIPCVIEKGRPRAAEGERKREISADLERFSQHFLR